MLAACNSHCQVIGNEVLLLVDGIDLGLFVLLADDRDPVAVFLLFEQGKASPRSAHAFTIECHLAPG
jgi:hypothetical protein